MPSDPLVELAERLQAGCIAQGLTVATAESCTGGLVAHVLTEVPGSSGYVRGGIVAYSDDVKQALLGVPGALLAAHGAVSAQVALAMAAGARAGRMIYVAGGLDRPDATQAQKLFFVLDLDHVTDGWRELAPWPGPERMLATAGASGADFFLFSGARLVADSAGKTTREWLRDAYRYTPGAGWKRIADLPRVAVAAPSPAPGVEGKLLVIGGDDGAQASIAPTEHKGFPRDVLAYDPAADRWARGGEVPFSLVTTTLARWREKIVIPGGEQRPGVRSPAVWAAEIK